MKIYDLNIDCIEKEKNKNNLYNLERRFIMDNNDLCKECQKYLKDNEKEDIFIKYKNKFYRFKHSSIEVSDSMEYCMDCDLEKECRNNLWICICEALIRNDIDVILKEVEEYEIVFGENKNEDI